VSFITAKEARRRSLESIRKDIATMIDEAIDERDYNPEIVIPNVFVAEITSALESPALGYSVKVTPTDDESSILSIRWW